HPTPPGIQLSQQDYRNRQILLNKVRNYWIKGVLETSLQGRVAIELSLYQRSDALERPWNALWETPDQARQPLPPGTRLIDKFDGLGAGRTLLILGEPGGGKTTTLLELARDLLNRAEQNLSEALPIVFNLSSWGGPEGLAKTGTIADWLVEELHTKYQVSPEIAKVWVQGEQLLLLLDGLDEVHSSCRNACVQALNEFSQTHGHTEMVVCSRLQDYEALSHRLRFQAAICLQFLSLDQIQHYLLNAGPELETIRTLLQTDPTLQELARSPLMLNMMTLACRGLEVSHFPETTLEERRRQLFDAYIDRMFQRRPLGPYRCKQYLGWLRWLAQNLQRTAETVFLIERMQPDWLPTRFHRWLYAIGIGVFAGLSCGLASDIVGYLILGWEAGLIYGLVFGIGGGILVALVFGILNHQIYPVETLKWSWDKARESLIPGIAAGLVSGPLIMVSMWLAYGLLFDLGERFIYSMIYGLLSGVGVGIIFVLL
ncbi:MAG: NACHT domain-containing protein, partial [Leptolyngbyaceae cyanobacterium bins.59]|nr:NACHT domain-containing protein [Leptolyngbyaceae cyanobacterium bins.59]